MNNLKRVLSLALSGIMLVGMMAMGASAADFTDADKIQHDDAVNILVALNVINGQDDGSFNPEGDVTRAQMAKMIAVALNGGTDANTGVKSTPSFTDIKGHWAESYIEYCADLGVISGRGDGTFAPDANVTGIEATKMVLTALGYDSNAYELTGPKWATQTEQLARQADPVLWEELAGVTMATAASRDTAAQLIWNGLQNSTVRINPTEGRNDGTISWGYGKTGKTLLKERYDADIVMGNFTGNYNTQATGTEKGEICVSGTTRVLNDKGDYVTSSTSYTFPSDFDISNIGEEVKVIYKNGKYSRTSGPDRNDQIFGVFPTGRTEVIWSTKGDVGSLKTTKNQVKLGDTTYDAAENVKVVFNYNEKAEDSTTYKSAGTKDKDGKDTTSALTDKLSATNGDVIKAIKNPNTGLIDTIYVTEYKIGAVTATNSDKVTISNVGSVDRDAADLPEGLAKGDVVVVNTMYDALGEDLAYTIVTKAEKVTGTVNRFKHDYNDDETIKDRVNVRLDDTVYKIHNKAALLSTIPDETPTTTFNDECLDEEFDLYLINGYVGAAIQISESANNYSVITAVKGGTEGTGTGKVFQDLQIQVMDAEGTKTILTVNDDSKKADGKTAATTAADFNVGDIVVWTGKVTDATVTIKDTVSTKAVKYNASTKSFDGMQVARNAVLFAETTAVEVKTSEKDPSGAKFKAYDLYSVRDQEATVYSYVTNNDDKIVAVFMDLEGAARGAADRTVYGIVTDRVGRGNAADGSAYHIFTVASNEETYTVNISVLAGVKKGMLIALEPTSDSVYNTDDVTIFEDGKVKNGKLALAVYVKEHDSQNGTLTYFTKVDENESDSSFTGDKATSKTYEVDKDAAIVYVNTDGDKAGADIGINAFDSVSGYKNAVVILSPDADDGSIIDAIFVETSNKEDIL